MGDSGLRYLLVEQRISLVAESASADSILIPITLKHLMPTCLQPKSLVDWVVGRLDKLWISFVTCSMTAGEIGVHSSHASLLTFVLDVWADIHSHIAHSQRDHPYPLKGVRHLTVITAHSRTTE